jgi:hypothetical protein
MLVDHRIKFDIEPELKLPPPRLIRRRAGRGFLFGLRHILLLPFILLALILLLALFNSLGGMIVGRKPFQPSVWGLLFATLFWNCCTAIFIWRIYAPPLISRWLVVHGQATLGHITGFTNGSGRGGILRVHYEFSPAGRLRVKGNAVVDSMKAWKELQEGSATITVVYSEKNPKWNMPYICAEYEAASAA